MKKIKLLAPLLACSSIAAMALPALVSCGQSDISMDSNKEQTTDANLTSVTYEFKVSNYSQTDDEIETEIVEEETETTDDVQVSISKTYYDPETGKYFVIVTISKEDGTLYDQEEIKFSLNINCHNKTTGVKKWGKKFDKLHIKHYANPLESIAHFDDTDVTKHIYQTSEGDQSAVMKFPIPATEKWTATEEAGTYGIDKLKIYAMQSEMGKAFSQIQITKNVEFEIKNDEEGNQNLIATIKYNIPSGMSVAIPASFYLLFTYEESSEQSWEAVFQTIGGFNIIKGNEPVAQHAILIDSRERHVYKEITQGVNEYSTNFIRFFITDSSFDISKFDVISSNPRVQINKDSIQSYDSKLIVPYSIVKDENHGLMGDNITNVTITLKYTTEDEATSWEQEFRGMSFFSSKLEDYTQQQIISCDRDKLPTEITIGTETQIDSSAFSTISPFDLSDIIYSTGIFTTGSETYTISFLFKQLQAGGTNVILYTDDTTLVEKSGLLQYTILLNTSSASYLYVISNNITIKAGA